MFLICSSTAYRRNRSTGIRTGPSHLGFEVHIIGLVAPGVCIGTLRRLVPLLGYLRNACDFNIYIFMVAHIELFEGNLGVGACPYRGHQFSTTKQN
jgi:hypothetical protein